MRGWEQLRALRRARHHPPRAGRVDRHARPRRLRRLGGHDGRGGVVRPADGAPLPERRDAARKRRDLPRPRGPARPARVGAGAALDRQHRRHRPLRSALAALHAGPGAEPVHPPVPRRRARGHGRRRHVPGRGGRRFDPGAVGRARHRERRGGGDARELRRGGVRRSARRHPLRHRSPRVHRRARGGPLARPVPRDGAVRDAVRSARGLADLRLRDVRARPRSARCAPIGSRTRRRSRPT